MMLRGSWLGWTASTSAAALAALLCLKSSPGLPLMLGRPLMLLCGPGLALDFLIGAADAGPTVYLLNLLVVAVTSGLFWGTLLFWAARWTSRTHPPA